MSEDPHHAPLTCRTKPYFSWSALVDSIKSAESNFLCLRPFALDWRSLPEDELKMALGKEVLVQIIVPTSDNFHVFDRLERLHEANKVPEETMESFAHARSAFLKLLRSTASALSDKAKSRLRVREYSGPFHLNIIGNERELNVGVAWAHASAYGSLQLVTNSDPRCDYVRGHFDEVWDKSCPIEGFAEEAGWSLNESLLGLGHIGIEPKFECSNALAAIFDLEGFTSFLAATDSRNQLLLIQAFLEWLFKQLDEGIKSVPNSPRRIGPPFFSKFMGDGVLLLWNLDGADRSGSRARAATSELRRDRIIQLLDLLWGVTSRYGNSPLTKQGYFGASVGKIPAKLRCGASVGPVISVGARDYVGNCINNAARLQKLYEEKISFAFSCELSHDDKTQDFVRVTHEIRGSGTVVPVLLRESEWTSLNEDDREKARLFPR